MADEPAPFPWRRHWLFLTAQVFAFCWAVFWFRQLPSPGYAVAVLAVPASAMSIHADMRGWQKMIWMLLIAAFLWIEFQAIDKTRREDENTQAEIRKQERDNFKSILDQGSNNLDRQQRNFGRAADLLLQSQRDERRQFTGVLAKQQALFDHEEQLAESLNGHLLPAMDQTPENNCGTIPPHGAIVMIGDPRQHNAATFSRFPHVIILSKSRGPVLSVDKSPDGSLAVILDIRSTDGKIIAKMDRNGFVLNRNNYLEAKRDKSSLVIIDEYGAEVLNLRYLNPQTLAVSGKGIGYPPGVRMLCTSDVGIDVVFP